LDLTRDLTLLRQKQRRLRKLKREEDYEEKLIENIELTVAYNDQQGPKMTQTMDPYLYKSKDSDIELRLLVQQLWHRLFEDVVCHMK
jgi:allophanate hydrolase subunit 1